MATEPFERLIEIGIALAIAVLILVYPLSYLGLRATGVLTRYSYGLSPSQMSGPEASLLFNEIRYRSFDDVPFEDRYDHSGSVLDAVYGPLETVELALRDLRQTQRDD